MNIHTHKITIESRYEGTPLDPDEQQQLATQVGDVISRLLEHRTVDGQFCDLGLKQDINITVGATT